MERLDPLTTRVIDEYREYLAHGAGVPIRRVRVDAGVIEVCGDRENLDRRGRQAITYVRPDQRLVLLNLADEADVPRECAQFEHAPLAECEPYTVTFQGKPRQFYAASKSFLMGVCPCGDTRILVACLDGGLAFIVGSPEGWICIFEPSWTAAVDLDVALRGREGGARVGGPPLKAKGKARGKARRDEDSDEEVREHHARLSEGLVPTPEDLKILRICFAQLSREAWLPNPNLAGNYKGREDLDLVTAGLLQAIANGCGNLGGREMDMLAQLRRYGVVLPQGALSRVLRLFILLGCPIVSQPKPKKDREFTRLWLIDVVGALDTKGATHLALVRSIRTPLCEPSARGSGGSQQREDRDEEAEADAGGTIHASRPEAQHTGSSGERATSEPDTSHDGAAAEQSARQARSPELSDPSRDFMWLTLGVLALAQHVAMLHQRFETAYLGAGPATVGAPERPDEPTPDANADRRPGHAGRSSDEGLADHVVTTQPGEPASGADMATADEPPADAPRTLAGAVHEYSDESISAELPDEPPPDVRAEGQPAHHADASTLPWRPGQRVCAEEPGEPPDAEVGAVDALPEHNVDAPPGAEVSTTDGLRATAGDEPSPAVDVVVIDGRLDHNTATLLATATATAATGRPEYTDPDDAHMTHEASREARFPSKRDDHELAVGDACPPHEHTDANGPMLPVKELSLTLGRWNFAAVIFLVMFEQNDPALVRVMALKAVSWMSDIQGPVELSGEKLWPRLARSDLRAGQLDGLACAEFLDHASAWVPMQAEAIDGKPRGPPPLGSRLRC